MASGMQVSSHGGNRVRWISCHATNRLGSLSIRRARCASASATSCAILRATKTLTALAGSVSAGSDTAWIDDIVFPVRVGPAVTLGSPTQGGSYKQEPILSYSVSEGTPVVKLNGVVIDGAIRDSGDIAKLGFPAFSRLVMPNAGEPKGFGEIGVPIRVGGVKVESGDWVLGDDDGVVHLPQSLAVEYANRAMDVLEKENRIREEIKEGRTLAQVTDLLRWEKKV